MSEPQTRFIECRVNVKLTGPLCHLELTHDLQAAISESVHYGLDDGLVDSLDVNALVLSDKIENPQGDAT